MKIKDNISLLLIFFFFQTRDKSCFFLLELVEAVPTSIQQWAVCILNRSVTPAETHTKKKKEKIVEGAGLRWRQKPCEGLSLFVVKNKTAS